MVGLDVIHNNSNSDCCASLGRVPSILLPVRPSGTTVTSEREGPLCPLHLPFIVPGCDSNALAVLGLFRKLLVSFTREFLFTLSLPVPSLHRTLRLSCERFPFKKYGKLIQTNQKDSITESEASQVCLTALMQDFHRLEDSGVKTSRAGLKVGKPEGLFVLEHLRTEPTYQQCFSGRDKNLCPFISASYGSATVWGA